MDAPTGDLITVKAPLNISALLPDDMSLWRYYGSLTTPSCNEIVHWTVFKKPMTISRLQVTRTNFKKSQNIRNSMKNSMNVGIIKLVCKWLTIYLSLSFKWERFLASKDSENQKLQDNNRPPQPTINRKATFFDHVVRERMPSKGEHDRNPPADDTFFDKAQKDINSKTGAISDEKNKQHNGANSGYGGLINSALTGFLFMSVFFQVLITSILRCR